MVLSRQEEKKTSITCSYIEIYNEQIFDLVYIGLDSYRRTSEFIRSGKMPKKEYL